MRSNRKWCKRRGSSLECQNCFFVYPIIDSNLKNFTGRIAAEGLFSIQELELLLLYAQRQMETRAGQGAKLLEDVLSYIQEHMTDIQAKNQIFPRAVCLYCRYVTGEANAQKRYLLCREAFENSRKDQRFEYTVELLGYMRKDAICLGKEFEAVSYQVWKKILEAMYPVSYTHLRAHET